jgi:molybdenum cofactor biosynthesis protein B
MSAPEQHRSYAPKSLGFAAITVSDSRVDDDDRSGQVMRELIVGAQHTLIQHTIVPDEVEEIRDTLAALLDTQEVDVVVLSGGTGLAPRDVTVAAIDPILSRRIEGFGELFRMLSYRQVGTAAMLSRAVAGVVGEQAVFALPGSPAAVRLAMEELILPEAAHLIGQIRRR